MHFSLLCLHNIKINTHGSQYLPENTYTENYGQNPRGQIFRRRPSIVQVVLRWRKGFPLQSALELMTAQQLTDAHPPKRRLLSSLASQDRLLTNLGVVVAGAGVQLYWLRTKQLEYANLNGLHVLHYGIFSLWATSVFLFFFLGGGGGERQVIAALTTILH